MIVAIHQPNFAPWLGYFEKMARADVFVLLDDAEFSKNSYTNRVRIEGDRWLSVPVSAPLHTQIQDVAIADTRFPQRHWGVLRSSYGRHSLIDEFVEIERQALTDSERLVDVNLAVLEFLRSRIGVDTPLVRSSEMGLRNRSTQRLVSIVTALGGDVYLSGEGAKGYQDDRLFQQAGIQVEYYSPRPSAPEEGFSFSALHRLLKAGETSPTLNR